MKQDLTTSQLFNQIIKTVIYIRNTNNVIYKAIVLRKFGDRNAQVMAPHSN